MTKLEKQYARNYILAGRSLVTFHNTKTGNQFTYLIKQKKDKETGGYYQQWFVCYHDLTKTYLGSINYSGNFTIGSDVCSEVSSGQPMLVFKWVWKHIMQQNLPNFIEVLRSDFCGRCGRELTEVISLKCGIGPECRRKLGIDDSKFK